MYQIHPADVLTNIFGNHFFVNVDDDAAPDGQPEVELLNAITVPYH